MPPNTYNSPLYLPFCSVSALCVSPLLTLPLSWVICCVNMVYLQLTGSFSCGAGNAITGCKHLHCYHRRVWCSFRSPLQRGRYWSLSALRRGLLMKPSENLLCSVKSLLCVCVCVFLCAFLSLCVCASLSLSHTLLAVTHTHTHK